MSATASGVRGRPLLGVLVRRSLWTIRGRLIAVAAIIACGVAILFAVTAAVDDLRQSQTLAGEHLHLADLEVRTTESTPRSLARLGDVDGVAEVEARLLAPGTMTVPGGETIASLGILQRATPTINTLDIVDGRAATPGTDEAVIEQSFAALHGLDVGETLTTSERGVDRELTVVGVAVSAEFLVATSNPDYVISEPGSLGVYWAPPPPGAGGTVNSVMVRFAATASDATTVRAVVAALSDDDITQVIPQSEGYSYKQINAELDAFGAYTPAIIVTLGMLALAMAIITFRRFAEEFRRQFGVLRTEGYPVWRIRRSLMRAGAVIGAVGSMAGIVLGFGLGWLFAEVYAASIHLPSVTHGADARLALICLAAGTVAGAVTIVLGTFGPLRRRAIDNLTPRLRGSTHPTRLTVRALPVSLRYALRTLWRERVLTTGSVLAVGGAVAVAVSYGFAVTSTYETIRDSFAAERWTHAVDFAVPLPAHSATDELAAAGITDAEPYLRGSVEIEGDGEFVQAVLVGLTTPGTMRSIDVGSGRTVAANGEAVLSSDVAEQLGVDAGDVVRLANGGRRLDVTVVGVAEDMYLSTVTTSLGTAQEVTGSPDVASGVYTAAGDSAVTALTGRDEVARVTAKQRLVEAFNKEMQGIMGIVYITIVFAVGVSVLYLTTSIYLTITEKRSELAVLRSFGFRAPRLRNMMMWSVGSQVAAALVLALPLSVAVATYLNQRMTDAWFKVNLHIDPLDIAWPMLAAVIVAPCVAWLVVRSVVRIDIQHVLRTQSL